MSTLKSGHTQWDLGLKNLQRAPASGDDCHASCTPLPAAPAYRVQVRPSVYVCVCVTWLWHTYMYTHTHMYTQVFHFQKQAVSAQWDASQGEKEKKRDFKRFRMLEHVSILLFGFF